MCLILFALGTHDQWPLLIAANRDEFFARPTARMDWWPDTPRVLAGRDLRAGGTWFGVAASGRWAALTNFRHPSELDATGPSRGALVADFLASTDPLDEYVALVRNRGQRYAGFNLLVGQGTEVHWLSNRLADEAEIGPEPPPYRTAHRGPLPSGVYGVSNHLLDTPWPKVERGKQALRSLITSGELLTAERLIPAMLDRTLAADHQVPLTGVPAEWERQLSPMFIVTPEYGTRATTALVMGREGTVEVVERAFHAGTPEGEDRHFRFRAAG